MQSVQLIAIAILFGLLSGVGCSRKVESHVPEARLSLSEICSVREVSQIERLALERGLAVEKQDNEAMIAQGILEGQQSRSLGASGRVWITFWTVFDARTVTLQASFYYDNGGFIVGRALFIENNNKH